MNTPEKTTLQSNKVPTNLEHMKTNRYVFFMSLPIFVELLLQLFVGNIDQIMISRYSQNSVAAIVNGNQIINIIIIVMNMMSMATTVILSKYLGNSNKEKANQVCTLSLTVITIIGSISTIITIFFSHTIFTAMNVEPDVIGEASIYLSIVGGFSLVQGLYLNFAAILRAHTYMKQVMYVSIFMNVLNIIGNAFLINGWLFFPKLGIIGAAISTVISKTIGLILMYLLLKRKTEFQLKRSDFRNNPMPLLKNILYLGFPSGLESLSYQLSQMAILTIINEFGTTATVTKGYCSILANFAYVYAIAIAQATQIVVGYLLGAMKINDLSKRVWSTLKIAFVCCVGLTILLFFNSDFVLRMFTNVPDILELGHRILFLEIFLEIGRSCNIVMTRMLISVGDAKTPMIVGISGHWVIAFLGSIFFGKILGLGLEGIWIAMAIDECLRGLIYVITFRTNHWKRIYTSAA